MIRENILRRALNGLLTAAFIGTAFYPMNLLAWGAAGHKTVGLIAQERLTPAAKAQVEQILGEGQGLESVATWADKILSYRPETASWHYIDIDVRTSPGAMGLSALCPTGDCVLTQVEKELEILKSSFSPRTKRKEALKFLVHFMGDLHQPLHCADDGDRGGNLKWFRYHRKSGSFTWVNLHGIWDRLIRVGPAENPEKLASRLGKAVMPEKAKEWSRGKPADWVFESFRIAKTVIYQGLSQGPIWKSKTWGKDLPEEYYSGEMRDIVELQLEKAGVRLAYLLNGLFKD